MGRGGGWGLARAGLGSYISRQGRGGFFLVSLPLSLYSTFVIEQKYGFNRMTLKLWLVDLLKSILLSLLIGGPILAGVLWFMDRRLRGLWWLYFWILLSLVQIFIAAIFPVLLLPLFNKLTPL